MFFDFVRYLLRLSDIENIKVVGLALSFTLSVIIQAFLLLYFVYKKLKTFRVRDLSKSLYKILISSFAMAIVVFSVRQFLVIFRIVELQTFLGVFFQLILSGLAGVFCYTFISYLLKSQELETIKESFFRQ